MAKSAPEEQHADQDEDGGNRIPDKMHPMDALTVMRRMNFGTFVLLRPTPLIALT